MTFIDKIRRGSIFVEPRSRPARFNPARFRMRVREFSTQIRTRNRRIRPFFQPVPHRRVAGQPLPPAWQSKGFRA